VAIGTNRIEGILLAAGESRRMGFPKPLLKIGGRAFVEYLSATMLPSVSRLVIVLGAHSDRVRAVISNDSQNDSSNDSPNDPRIAVVENPDYALGQLSSLKVGLAQLDPAAGAALVHLVDHPTVSPATFQNLIGEYQRSGKPIVIARYRGRRGHPVIFDRSVFRELLDAPLEEGARAVVNRDSTRVGYLETDDAGVVLDLDTPADLERARLPLPPCSR
jgi:molybdenum cofactor cytidylyltransferase